MHAALKNLKSALQSIREQRTRALLSAVGVMVGSLAIVLLISIAKGVQADITKQVDSLGVNLLVVIPNRITEGSMFSPNLAGVSYLQDVDVERVRQVPGVRRAAPLMFVGGGLKYKKKESPTTFIMAAGPDWFQIHASKLAEGQFYGHGDGVDDVCVIGSIAKKNLFGSASALGKEIEINARSYKVVAVTEDPDSEDSLFSMGGFENIAYIPYAKAKEVIPNPQLHRIMIETEPDREPKELVSSVERVLGQRLTEQQFSVLTQKDLLKLVYKLMGILTWLLTGLTSIALFVGGVGIMTVMLMSVNERAREIGIRKTVGAKRSDIFSQFFFEALILTLAGGLAGLGISYAVCLLLANFTLIKPMITSGIVALSFGVSVGVGGVFGLLPAMRAAAKDPVVSLRNET